MSRFGIIVNVDKCVGCHACAIACKEENQVAPGIFYERVERFENIADNFINWFRVSCMHCDKPACMPVCPAKAIHRGPAGEVLVDQKKCIGCRMCERACPYGAPKFNASGETNYFGGKTPLAIRELEPWQRHAAGRAEHCTLCTHRTSQGRPPACGRGPSDGHRRAGAVPPHFLRRHGLRRALQGSRLRGLPPRHSLALRSIKSAPSAQRSETPSGRR